MSKRCHRKILYRITVKLIVHEEVSSNIVLYICMYSIYSIKKIIQNS